MGAEVFHHIRAGAGRPQYGNKAELCRRDSNHLQPDSLCGFLDGLSRYRSINTPVSASSPSKTIMATPYDYAHVTAEQEYQPDRADRRNGTANPLIMVLKSDCVPA